MYPEGLRTIFSVACVLGLSVSNPSPRAGYEPYTRVLYVGFQPIPTPERIMGVMGCLPLRGLPPVGGARSRGRNYGSLSRRPAFPDVADADADALDCRLAIGAHHFRGGILVAQSRSDRSL